MKNKLTLILLLILVLLSVSFNGCKSKKDVELTPGERGSDKEIYQKARKQMKRDPEKARLLFKEIMHLYPDSIYARRSKIGIADSYYRQKDSASMIMAATEYQEYVNLYPHSPDAVYAKLQIAMCYYKQVKKPGRDQTSTHQAVKALAGMIKQYPDTKEAGEAKKMMAKARLNLANHYFAIGISNFRLKAFQGAVVRFKQVIDDYPEFPNKDKLFFFTGKSYYGKRDLDSAISFFQKIVNSYPKSKYIKKAQGMIKTITQMKEKISKQQLKMGKKKKDDKKEDEEKGEKEGKK
jgi:outer membrane protein assembly factor BamD